MTYKEPLRRFPAHGISLSGEMKVQLMKKRSNIFIFGHGWCQKAMKQIILDLLDLFQSKLANGRKRGG